MLFRRKGKFSLEESNCNDRIIFILHLACILEVCNVIDYLFEDGQPHQIGPDNLPNTRVDMAAACNSPSDSKKPLDNLTNGQSRQAHQWLQRNGL